MNKLLVLIALMATLISCSETEDDTEVNIRLSNVSEFDFREIVVDTSTGNVSFEDIESGQSSNYQTFEQAYSYAFIELTIDENTYTIQPIDYMGESLLKSGNYTYKIDANDSEDQYGKLTLSLIED